MKKNIFAFIIALILLLGTAAIACEPPIIEKTGGNMITQEFPITDFTRVQTGYAYQVEITPSERYSIAITAREDILKHIDVSKSGDTLVIKQTGLFWQLLFRGPVKVKITMPLMTGLDLSGASRGTIKGFNSTRDFGLALSGASSLEIDMETGAFKAEISGASKTTGNLKATLTELNISGASHIILAGSSGDLKIDGSGASSIDLDKFSTVNASVKLSGGSKAIVNTSGTLDGAISGASSLEYKGNPKVGKIDSSGASSFKQK